MLGPCHIRNPNDKEMLLQVRCVNHQQNVKKQAEAKVVPSSSSFEVEVEVIGLRLRLRTLVVISAFTGRWVVGKLESSAKLNLRSD